MNKDYTGVINTVKTIAALLAGIVAVIMAFTAICIEQEVAGMVTDEVAWTISGINALNYCGGILAGIFMTSLAVIVRED